MARTGRFGRLPTQAPDLSSQIVSMMEQYTAAQDRNILDAWQNGGTYQGKRVTDKDILDHYKKRRSEYKKDEPEYDQWNQDIWQLRYQIADEKVQSAYRRGKIGPKAVANHYKRWAKKMPRNSSFARNLMAAYGDYMKAAAAGKGGGSGGGGGASGANAYARLQQRIKDLDKQERESVEFLDLLSQYARDRGYIPGDADITSPGVWDSFEAAEMQMMLDGVMEWDRFDDWAKGMVSLGYTTFKGKDGFERSDVVKAINKSIRIKKDKIAAYRQYPGDMSSYEQAERNEIRTLKGIRRQVRPGGLIDTKADWNESLIDFLGEPGDPDGVGYNNAESPSDAIHDVDQFERDTRKLMRQADRNGDGGTALVAEVILMSISAARDGTSEDPQVQADVLERINNIQNQYPDLATDFAGSLFAQPGSLTDFSRVLQIHFNGDKMLRDGTGVKVPHAQPTSGELPLGAVGGPKYTVWSMERGPDGQIVARNPFGDEEMLVGGNTTIVSEVRKDDNGNNYIEPVLITGKVIEDPQGNPWGIVWEHNNHRVWGVLDTDTGLYRNLTYDPFTEAGATLTYSGGRVIIDLAGVTMPEDALPGEIFGPRAGEAGPVLSLGDIGERLRSAILNDEVEDPEAAQKVMDVFNGDADVDTITSDGTTVETALAQLGVPESVLQAYVGTELYEDAAKAVLNEVFRQQGQDVEYTAEDAVFISPSGRLRTVENANILVMTGGGQQDVDTRARLVEEAQQQGISVSQAQAQHQQVEQVQGGMGSTFYDIESVNTGPDAVTSTVGDPNEPSSLSEWIDGGPGQETYETQGITAAFESYVTELSRGATYSPELALIMVDMEKRELLHQDPNLFLPVIALSAKNQMQAELMMRDAMVVLTENGLDDQLKTYAASGARREVDEGFTLAMATAQNRLQEAIGVRFGTESELWGANLNIFGGEQAQPQGSSFFQTAYDVTTARASETQVETREPVVAEPVQPDIALPQPLAQVAGVAQRGVMKVANTVNSALSQTYIAQTASPANIQNAPSARISPITPVSVNNVKVTPGVKVNIPSVDAAKYETNYNPLPKGYTYTPPAAPPPAPDIDTALGQIT